MKINTVSFIHLVIYVYCTRIYMKNTYRKQVILVLCGSFNPITYSHLRNLHEARNYAEHELGYDVLYGVISPVNNKYNKKGLISSDHRVNMINLALETSHHHDSINIIKVTENNEDVNTENAKIYHRPQFHIKLDTWEIEQNMYIRTYFVLQHVKNIFLRDNDDINDYNCLKSNLVVILVCGEDVIESMLESNAWCIESLKNILEHHEIIVIPRNTYRTNNISMTECDLIQKLKLCDIFSPHMDKIHFFDKTKIQYQCTNNTSSSAIREMVKNDMSIKYLTPDSVIEYIRKNKLYL